MVILFVIILFFHHPAQQQLLGSAPAPPLRIGSCVHFPALPFSTGAIQCPDPPVYAKCPPRPSLGQAAGNSCPASPPCCLQGRVTRLIPRCSVPTGPSAMPGQGRKQTVILAMIPKGCEGKPHPICPAHAVQRVDSAAELTEVREGHGMVGRARRKWSNPSMSRDLPQTYESRGWG